MKEWKRKMTHGEYESWCRYRLRHGPMTMDRRYDRPAALLATMWSSKAKMTDFLPWPQKSARELEAEAIFNELMGGG